MASEQENASVQHKGVDFGVLAKYPQLRLAVIAQFFYVGAQVATWSNFILYMKTYTTQPERACGYFLTGSLVALAVGRFVSVALLKYVSAIKLMRIYALTNILLVLFAVSRPGMAGAMCLLATSFFMSIMFPTIFALGVKGLASDTQVGGSLIVTTIVGGAIFPLALGVIARSTGRLSLGFIVPAIGFAVVAIYGFAAARGVREREIEAAPVV